MDDLQMNISAFKKKPNKKSNKPQSLQNNDTDYKFKSKPDFSGKIIARKRPQNIGQKKFSLNKSEEPQNKIPKLTQSSPSKEHTLASTLRDLSENKGKFHGKNYQEINDEIQINQTPRSGPWISSLFKNNPDVPKMGQKAVKPLVEKVFTGKTFSDLNIHPHSISNLKQNLNLTELMTVQQKAVPIILEGRDVLIRSQTGSGKTLAYALPVIEGLQAIRPKINRHDGVRVIVVVPTRELAVQTYELFVKLVKPFIWIVPGLLSGGQKRKAEKARLRKGLSILVGTPGRINDHLRHTHSLNFAKTGCLVLDEADRLLDMGYEKDVAAIVKAIEDHKKAATYNPLALIKQTINKKIDANDNNQDQNIENGEDVTESGIKHPLTKVFMSKERQTILLSATLTKAVENLAGITMQDPVFVDTSDGKTLVADSLKPTKPTENIKVNDQSLETNKQNIITELEKTVSSKIEVNDNKEESRSGLKAFNGSLHPELFVNSNNETVKSTKPTDVKHDVESDSDSDYEYFKVQKEIENKNDSLKVEEEKTEENGVPESKNTFVQAIKTAIVEDELVLPATVNQTFLLVPMKLRLVTLCSLIVEHCVLNKKGGKMIVFMATLEMVDYHTELIETVLTGKDAKKKNAESKKRKTNIEKGNDEDDSASEGSESEFEIDYEAPGEGGLVPIDLDVFSLHGSMPHEQRIEVFKQFRAAKRGLLICTDVAARGLDLPKVDLVLQYCAPASATDYVHRVGRTGRAAQVGAAVMFLLPSEAEFVRHLEQKRIRLLLLAKWTERDLGDEARCVRSNPQIKSALDSKVHEALHAQKTEQLATSSIERLLVEGVTTLSNGNTTQREKSALSVLRIVQPAKLRQSDESRALDALQSVVPSAPTRQRAAIAVQTKLEYTAHSSKEWLARASRAFTSWVRFYSGYPREVRMWLDARLLHLGHAAKAFALRETPAALARRARSDPKMQKEKPSNRLTIHDEEQKKRPGFPKIKVGIFAHKIVNKQSSMHTASEFDSGLPPVDTYTKKIKKN